MKKVFQAIAALLIGAVLYSCDEDTAGLGWSVVPESDRIDIQADSCIAMSRTIVADDSLTITTTDCNLGKFTELMGASFESGFITQLNCPENYTLPDSVYGIGSHTWPQWFIDAIGDKDPYYATLNLYFTSFFGDSSNVIRIDVFELDNMVDGGGKYYPDVDPSRFCDTEAQPLASISASAWSYQNSDSLRYLKNYYPNISVRLPDSFAKRILEGYYSSNGAYFKDARSFMNNLCKGFYVRCSQGDGTVLYVKEAVLQVNFKCIDTNSAGTRYAASYMADFPGNGEVMQMNCFRWTGLDSRLNDDGFTWIMSPFGLLTEIDLPVDDMKKDGSVLNSAQMQLSCAITPSARFKASAPGYLMLIRKDKARDFFSRNNNQDEIESFVTQYSNKYGTYTYSNIAAMVERIYSDREEWLKEKGKAHDAAGLEAYQNENPSWNKLLLIPVSPKTNSNGSILGFMLDIKMHQVKLLGGKNGSPIIIKTIRSKAGN